MVTEGVKVSRIKVRAETLLLGKKGKKNKTERSEKKKLCKRDQVMKEE
jgi:hypothetical protein